MKTKKFKKLMGVVLALSLIIGLMSPVLNLFAGAADADKAAAVESLKSALLSAKRNLPITVTKWDNYVAKTGGNVTAADGKVEFTSELNNSGSASNEKTAAGVYYTLAEAAADYNVKIADIDDIKFTFNQKDGACNFLLYIFNTNNTYTSRNTYFEGKDFFGVGQSGGAGKLETGVDNEASIKTFYDANDTKNWSDRATINAWTTMNNERYFASLYAQTATLKDCTGITFNDGTLVYNDPAFAAAAKALNADDVSTVASFVTGSFDSAFITNEAEYNAAVNAVKSAFGDDLIKYNLETNYNELYDGSVAVTSYDLRNVAFTASGTTTANTQILNPSALPDAENAPLFGELGNAAVQYTFNTATDTSKFNSNGLFADKAQSPYNIDIDDLDDISFWYYADKAVGTFKITVYCNGFDDNVTYTDSSMAVKQGWNKFCLKDYDVKKALKGKNLVGSSRFIASVVIGEGESLTLTMGSPFIYEKSKIAQESFATIDAAYKASVAALSRGFIDDGGKLAKAVADYENAHPDYKELKLDGYIDAAKYVLNATKTLSYPLYITAYNNGTANTCNELSVTFGSDMHNSSAASDNSGNLKGQVILSNSKMNVNISEVKDITVEVSPNNVTKVNAMFYLGNGTARTARGNDIDNSYFASVGNTSRKVLTNNSVNYISIKDLYSESWNNRAEHSNFKTNAAFKDMLINLAAFSGGTIKIENAYAVTDYDDADLLIAALDEAKTYTDKINALVALDLNHSEYYSNLAELDCVLAYFRQNFDSDPAYENASKVIGAMNISAANAEVLANACANLEYIETSFIPQWARNGLDKDNSEVNVELLPAQTGDRDFTYSYSAHVQKNGSITTNSGSIKAVSATPVDLNSDVSDVVFYVKSSANVKMRIFPTLGDNAPNGNSDMSSEYCGFAYRKVIDLSDSWTKISFKEVYGENWKDIAKLATDGSIAFDSIDTLYLGVNGTAELQVTPIKVITKALGDDLISEVVSMKNAAFKGNKTTFDELETAFVNHAKQIDALGEFGNIGGHDYLDALVTFLNSSFGKYSEKYYITGNYAGGLSVRDAIRFNSNNLKDSKAAEGVTIDSLLAEIAK